MIIDSAINRISLLFLVAIIWIPYLKGGEGAGTIVAEKCEMCKSPPPALNGFIESKWLSYEERKSVWSNETTVSRQDGSRVKFKDIFDRPTALTFLYTRCDNPNKCPLVASTMVQLAESVKKAGIEKSVRLCVMTYDPEYDTPQILKEYAVKSGILCNEDTMLLRPEPNDAKDLFKAMSVSVNYDEKRVNIHGIQLLLLDGKGRLAKSYQTLIWDNTKVLEDLSRLLNEGRAK